MSRAKKPPFESFDIDLNDEKLKDLILACHFNYIHPYISDHLEAFNQTYTPGRVKINYFRQRFAFISDIELIRKFTETQQKPATLRELIMLHLQRPLMGSAINIARGTEIIINSRKHYPGIFRQGEKYALNFVALPENNHWAYARFAGSQIDNI